MFESIIPKTLQEKFSFDQRRKFPGANANMPRDSSIIHRSKR